MSQIDPATATPSPPPSLSRRLASFVYEGVLLFGVLMVSDYLFSSLTQQRHALYLREAGMAFLFIVLGIYFVWFWSRSGQTVAMKTWNLRVVTRDGAALTQRRALARYAAAWLWFLPPLALVGGMGVTALGGGGSFTVVATYVLAYAGLSFLLPHRQFLHDTLCGTRLVTFQQPARRA
jgi:uncharacterized RDD family membrane protein YckC